MAKLNVNAKITAPSEITVPLIRADHAEVSNVFRVCFEVFLSVFSCLLGVIVGSPQVGMIHWVFLAFAGIGAMIFMVVSYKFSKPAEGVS